MITGFPELDELLARVYAYREETHWRLGCPPDTVLVTEHEYRQLLRYEGYGMVRTTRGDYEDMRLFGMTVVLPQHLAWDGQETSWVARQRSMEPLPPLDEIDEGLRCCGVTYPTFAEFMTHQRQHGWDGGRRVAFLRHMSFVKGDVSYEALSFYGTSLDEADGELRQWLARTMPMGSCVVQLHITQRTDGTQVIIDVTCHTAQDASDRVEPQGLFSEKDSSWWCMGSLSKSAWHLIR
jgi:hypothetical protein